jgi:G3E family GTPase
VTVIGGYLGAGKTTLVNHLLHHANGRRIAVLVNEFGALPIDRDLILSGDGDTIDIAGGCVCCGYGSDLIAALMALLHRRPDIEHVVLEASGVALPGMVAMSLGLLSGYALDSIIVLADAETVREYAADRYLADTIARQLAAADLVLLNKSDLVGAGMLHETAAWLASTAPAARVVSTSRCAVPIELVFGLGPGAGSINRQSLASGSSAAESLYESIGMEVPHPTDVEAVGRALAAECEVLRAKGFLWDLAGRLRSVQIVGRRCDVAEAPPNAAAGILSLIGLRGQLNRAVIEAILAKPALSA